MSSLNEFVLPDGRRLLGVHDGDQCSGLCVIHNPIDETDHTFEWPLIWRTDRGIFERACPHGIGHPATEQIAFWNRSMSPEDAEAQRIHGCDGCCGDPLPELDDEPELLNNRHFSIQCPRCDRKQGCVHAGENSCLPVDGEFAAHIERVCHRCLTST